MTTEDYREKFYKALDACGIANPITEVNGVKRRKYTPHSCRHSCASMLIAMGWSLKDVQEWLGHSDVKMTANIYAHLDTTRKNNIAESLAEKFGA